MFRHVKRETEDHQVEIGMAEVKILVEGYTIEDSRNSGKEETRPTITLVKDKNLTIVVDPGVLENQQILVGKLEEEGLRVDDIDIVCITHHHLDHYRNVAMFPKAKTLIYKELWEGARVMDWSRQLTDNIEVIETPGHSYDGISLLVKTKEGVVAIVGDVFWKEALPVDDPYADDKRKLEQSRERVKKLADYVIPGHGTMFRTKRALRTRI